MNRIDRTDEIRTDRPLTQISDGARFSVHAYYDICPESPDGRHLVYFRFDGDLPGPGEVVVAEPDGSNPRVVGRSTLGNPHVGAYQQWLDDETVAFNDVRDGRPVTRMVSIGGEVLDELPSGLRMVHPASRRGLVPVRWAYSCFGLDAAGVDDGVDVLDFQSGAVRRLLSVGQAIETHPKRDAYDAGIWATVGLGHTKWSGDGSLFMFVMKNEGARRKNPDLPRIKSIFTADRDGRDLTCLAEAFGHHPGFSADGRAVYASGTFDQGAPGLTVYPVDGAEPYVLEVGRCGHPTLDRDAGRILTDLEHDPEKDRASVLLYDVSSGGRQTLATFAQPFARHGGTPPFTPPQAKSDPHPAWSRDKSRVYFNAKGESGVATLFALHLE